MTLFGWDMNTWDRAWSWAIAEGFEPKEFNIDAPYENEITIRKMWFEHGGPRSGPKGEFYFEI